MSEVVDLANLFEAAGDGVHWTLDDPGDLNANFVRLEPGHRIDEHVNDEVDVLVVVLAGSGELTVDGRRHRLTVGTVGHVPKTARREVCASGDGLDYVTVHRRRSGPSIGRDARREQ